MARKKYKHYRRNYTHRRRYRKHQTPLLGTAPFLFLIVVTPLLLWIISSATLTATGVIAVFFSILALLTAVIFGFIFWKRHQKIAMWRILDDAQINIMDGIEFEHFLKAVLEANAYQRVRVTQASGDYGTDLLARKDGVQYAIQAKRYSGYVGIEGVQQIIGGMTYYDCDAGMVITTSHFSTAAKNLAQKAGVVLIGRKELAQLIRVFRQS